MSLTDRLANLQLLLNASSFRRWPLQVTFYAKDVFKLWQRASKQYIGRSRSDLSVHLHEPKPDALELTPNSAGQDSVAIAPTVNAGIYALSVDHSSMKSRLEETMALFASGRPLKCTVCRKHVPATGSATLVCPGKDCLSVTHVQCMSAAFLAADGNTDAIIPTSGQCPKCNTSLQWVDLVKDLTLRMRGEKEIAALFKPKRGKKNAGSVDEVVDSEDELDEPDEDALDIVFEMQENQWQELSESSQDEAQKPAQTSKIPLSQKHASFKRPLRETSDLEPVIDDSDWNDAEIIT